MTSRVRGSTVFGPSKAAARLEGSKAFTKDLCRANAIPTADYERFSSASRAKAYVRTKGTPIVIKADGLAAGKGVVIAATFDDAAVAIDGFLHKPSSEIVVEEYLDGEEASFFALCDGETAIPLASAQDHKRAFDGDQGPNTGGMGAYSPAPVLTEELTQRVMEEIVSPTLRAMRVMGAPYRGVLYAGLMICGDAVRLLEYNVRFGDPECQVLMPRLMSDLVPALLAARQGALRHFDLRWYSDPALGVVMATRGYPGQVRTGSVILGTEEAEAVPGVQIFHGGTRRDGDRLLAAGGRVLTVVGQGESIGDARRRVYSAVDRIRWPEGFYRTDIGWRAVGRADGTEPS